MSLAWERLRYGRNGLQQVFHSPSFTMCRDVIAARLKLCLIILLVVVTKYGNVDALFEGAEI
jgi:hypothetical protein